MKTVDFIKKVEGLGYTVYFSEAATGSAYIRCERGDMTVTVRVSDHAECYPPAKNARQISVSPGELTVEQALDALKAPESIEPYRPAPLTPAEKEAIAIEAARIGDEKKRWKELRAELPATIFEEFKMLGSNRPAARKLAAEYSYKPGVLFAALTNGRNF